jgi:hypothetical protein
MASLSHRVTHRRFVTAVGVALGVVICIVAVAPAAMAAPDDSAQCESDFTIRLWADEAKTSLVDFFTILDAPTRHKVGSNDYVVDGEGNALGVDVVGAITGEPYTFEFRLSAGTNLTVNLWRVKAKGQGIVSEARNMWVRGELTQKQRGLFLEGNAFTSCSQF